MTGQGDPAALDRTLVRICDLAGRPRGTGFAADDQGTVITSHETVDGLARLVLHAEGERVCVVTADAVAPLPGVDLALVRTEGLGLRPLPVTVREAVPVGSYVRIAARGWREARILGPASVTYTATDRFHLVDAALELAIGTDGADALRLGGGAAGGPVVDASSGAVLAVLGTALHGEHSSAGIAVPLRDAAAADPGGPLAELLVRNAATVPAYGRDLNLAGALHLTATSLGSDGPRAAVLEPVERPDTAKELAEFTDGPAQVLGLVGDPGTGRTTELVALAARRARGAEPAPTLWLRGADLQGADTGVGDAVERALERAGRIVEASEDLLAGADDGLGDISAGRVARLVRDRGRPLLLLLDGPEEMPPVLAHRLAEWSDGTAEWLRDTGARLVVACRAEYWEQAGEHFPAELLQECVRLGDLPERQARLARARYGIPEGALAAADARHPLALRLLSEVRAALPDAPPPGRPGREEIFAAYLDLLCLRVAVRLAASQGLRGGAVRRLAAKVSGQVHEAARRCLGPGQGELDRASFEEVFPWGTGWASAVLTEGLLTPAGDGYRFAHEEVADWIQGMHLDVDGALWSLVHRYGAAAPRAGAASLPVPRHRIGPVIQALLQLGPAELEPRLRELARFGEGSVLPGASEPGSGRCAHPFRRAERLPTTEAEGVAALAVGNRPAGRDGWAQPPLPGTDAPGWWASHLLSETLARVPDASPYRTLLAELARQGRYDAEFWLALPLPEGDRFDLLRDAVIHDPPPGSPQGSRCLDAVAELLARNPAKAQPHLTRWFTDERPLAATPQATVASAAQALLHTHRHRAIDDLTEALVDSAHPRADELLAVLAEEEPSAICRAVDRWVHDERPARRVAAVAYGLRAAPHATTDADRELLRYAAFALLARPGDETLHGAALALLIRDPQTRTRHLPPALRHFTAGDPQLPASALVAAFGTHPEPVIAAFRKRLYGPGPAPGDVLRSLADVTAPGLARRVADLVRDVLELRPDLAGHVAAYLDLRLEQGPGVRAVLLPLVMGLLNSRPPAVRAALAAAVAAPGTDASRALRGELLDVLLDREREPEVLDAVLCAAAAGGDESRLRALVHRTGQLLVRTPDGATCFDRRLVELARSVPGFAAAVARWMCDAPQEWAALVGPSARRMIENVAGARVPA
ncbi:trypsin-like peptidase domain-containing protein [Streptomyces sp. NPDC021622]|uniref:trypsin-like peptidase domain-containing protein n=1 Tax=Streptomyces sp. NPDC021622 TaxID=3155013 RepID=UPI0033CC4A1B